MNHIGMAGKFVLAGLVAGTSAATFAATNPVTFIGGGYAELCSAAAHHVDEVNHVELTGSRMSMAPEEICTLAIEDEPGTDLELAGVYTNRGVLLFGDGKLEEALRDFDQALLLADTLAAAHINRAYTLVVMQRWADSIPSFDRGIALGAPEPARAHFNRGIALEELGNLRGAYNDYKTASELDPEWDEPKRELARFVVR